MTEDAQHGVGIDRPRKTTKCYRCDDKFVIQEDEWWQHQWKENPNRENVEKAIEDRDFRDWFQKNYVLCPDCHEVVVSVVEGRAIPQEGQPEGQS